MLSLFAQSELKDLIEKVEQGVRLDFEAGVRLMESKDILALGYMANLIRERKNGDQTYFFQDVVQDLNMKTNATIRYGHNETIEEHVNYLLQLRELQDNGEGFLTFTTLPYYSNETKIEGNMGVESTTGFEDLRMLAVSRILLDNFDHIKALWVLLGPKLAQVSLKFGVDDLYSVETEQGMTKKSLIKMIHKAGRQAIERDSQYHVIKDYGFERGQN